jgi:hypothetical protein
MRWNLIAALALLLAVGCRSAIPKHPEEQSAIPKALHSDRLKRNETTGISPLIIDPDKSIDANGIWIPEPDDGAHKLVFPEQTHIICNTGAEYCIEMKNSFIVYGNIITVKGPEQTLWQIKSWDKNSLVAEYGPFLRLSPDADNCQKHVLSIVFASGTVTTSDIPSNTKGCEPFKETNTYRMASGYYIVDVSPNNDTMPDTAIHK